MCAVPRVRPTRAATVPRAVGRAGQSTVEFALVLPLLVTVLLLVVQVVLVLRDRLLLEQALHEAARVAALGADGPAVTRAARRTLAGAEVSFAARGDEARVRIRFRSATDVALVGPMLPDPVLRAEVTVGRYG